MPLMYRPAGVSKFFNNPEDGEKAGFYPSYNAMAIALAAALEGGSTPDVPVDDCPPPPPPEPTECHGHTDVASMTLEVVKQLAEAHGIDVNQHHKTLRKAVDDAVNVKS